ncbi:ATP-binding cassette domain-containing protein [Paenalcaligenes hominis]|uniref:ATP-binding cassette domain-containing protein n=1 Tax=Paenalcaligenes hominis TaxID=643674 RepID=UPI003524D95F
MIELRDVAIYRQQRCLLQHLTFSIQSNELLCILGPNGVGKSSLLKALAAEQGVRCTGSLQLNQSSLVTMTPSVLARQRAVLSQNTTIEFDLNVTDIVAMGAYPFMNLAPSRYKVLFDEAIQLAGIEAFTKKNYRQLSGGEQQRVQFARVILQTLAALQYSEQTVYLFLDEPTSSLDPHYQHQLLARVKQLTDSYPVAAVAVLHDVNLAAMWGHKLLLLAPKKAVSYGVPTEVLTTEHLFEAFGVQTLVQSHPQKAAVPLIVYL